MKKKKENLISQAEAAKIAGVSRQAIGKMKSGGHYNFFAGEKKNKVDINSKDWNDYIEFRENEKNIDVTLSNKPVKKKSVAKSKFKPQQKVSKKKPVKKTKKSSGKLSDEKLIKSEKPKQTHSLTGGFDPTMMTPTTPSQLKSLTDIQEKNINMRVKLNELVEVEMVVSIMEIITKDIKSFINLSRKVSNLICQKLDCVGMEKKVESIIDPEVESIIKMLKKNMVKAIDIKSYK
jgi:hypothetical protein